MESCWQRGGSQKAPSEGRSPHTLGRAFASRSCAAPSPSFRLRTRALRTGAIALVACEVEGERELEAVWCTIPDTLGAAKADRLWFLRASPKGCPRLYFGLATYFTKSTCKPKKVT